ncbi:uncharacterized protein [Venturia canescens]|uniref:uncharacterized protein n=1 Tax=Venturia canescens TaxID=32260 RepID=UPI001C9C6EE8|nr:uncharacterized protein LOC122412522 [Venturia canescens]
MLPRILFRWTFNFRPGSPKFSHKCSKSDRRKKLKFSPLMRTSIIMQDGRIIDEAEIIVHKIRDINDIIFSDTEVKVPDGRREKKIGKYNDNKKEIHIETDEGTAILFITEADVVGNKSHNNRKNEDENPNFSKRVGPIIENTMTDEINSRVAFEALKEIMRFEIDDFSCGQKSSLTETEAGDKSLLNSSNGREKVLEQLIDMIAKTRNNEMIIDGLALLNKDRVSTSRNAHKDCLCDEALIRATEGQFHVSQMIELVKILSSYGDSKYHEAVDNLWIGIKARECEINEKNLAPLFKILPFFRESRRLVKTILDRKLITNWWRLNGSQMSDILEIMFNYGNAKNALVCARKWSKLHINTAQESELFDFMKTITKLRFTEKETLESSLARFMRAKGLTIKDPALIALVMNYCSKNRIRNIEIFNACTDYLMKHSMDIPASLLAPIFVPFGYLNFRTPKSDEFLKTFQVSLESKFSTMATNDALNIILSLIYLEQTPLNLVDQLFTSKFFEQLHLNRDTKTIMYLREKLCFLDRAMAIECDHYACRMIPEIHCKKRVFMRSRLKRVTELLFNHLSKISGGDDKLSRAVMIGQLSMIDLYTLDILIHPRSINTSIFPITNDNENIKTAVLIHLPEHYCHNTNNLIGPQEMRIRHLKKLGFRVVALNYMTILALRNSPKGISDYITRKLRSVD